MPQLTETAYREFMISKILGLNILYKGINAVILYIEYELGKPALPRLLKVTPAFYLHMNDLPGN